MDSHSYCNCQGNSANVSVHQTLSEMDWERGIWNAAFSGDKLKVISLIEKSRNARNLVNSLDNAGYSALHYAAGRGHVDICNILLKNGASIDHQTKSGKATPLHKAAAAGKTSTLKFLIENGANIELQDDDEAENGNIGKSSGTKVDFFRQEMRKNWLLHGISCIHILVSKNLIFYIQFAIVSCNV